MHTPFQVIRSKHKNRRSKLEQCKTPPIFAFSLENSRREHSLEDKKDTKVRSAKIKSYHHPKQRNSNQEQQNYQITVKNTLKKFQLYRSSLKKNHQKVQQKPSPALSNRNSSKMLIIEGSPCNKELIRANKRKLQHMIEKIKGYHTPQKPEAMGVSQAMISKGAFQILSFSKPRTSVINNLYENSINSVNKINVESNSARSKSPNNKSNLYESTQTEQRLLFNPNQYLICSQIKNKSNYEANLEFVLNSKTIVDFIKHGKKKKPQQVQKQKPREAGLRHQYNFYLRSQRKAVCKTEGIKRNESAEKSQSNKKIKPNTEKTQRSNKIKNRSTNTSGIKINAINFDHLRGWQIPSETIDDAFIVQSYAY